MPLDVRTSRARPLEHEEGDQSTQNKKRRIENGRYAPGSILRVSLKNFVTYTSAEFYPGPNLNLIIGPNGSGKSTIVCAICIGLGFKPEVLGRATSPADFVQHGKDMAEIEIELAAENDESVVIKRRIKRDKNQSTYYINGKQDTLGKVHELMQSFNIQIDNLCQFLPQDRVANFAQLSPHDLLHETQRAVGGEEMVNHWQKLVEFRAGERALQQGLQNDTKTLTNLKQRQEAAKAQVERFQRQNEIIARIEKLKISIPVAKYVSARREVNRCKGLRNEARSKAYELQEQHQPLKERTDAYDGRAKACTRQVESLTKDYTKLSNKIKECQEDNVKFDNQASDLRGKRTRINKNSKGRVKAIAKLKDEIVKAEYTARKTQEKFDQYPPGAIDELSAKIAHLNNSEKPKYKKASARARAEGRELADERNEFLGKRREKEQELQNLLSVTSRRLEAIRNNRNPECQDVYEVVNWLEEKGGKGRFKNQVFGPPLLCLGVKDKSLARIAEGCFRSTDLLTFTCLSREDFQLFSELVIDNKDKLFRKRMNVRVIENSRGKQFKDWASPCSDERLKSLGFDFWLKDLLTGPEDVLNTLCHTNGIHALAISRKEFSNSQCTAVADFIHVDRGRSKNVIEKFVAGNVQYSIVRSRYGKQGASTISNVIRVKNSILADTVDLARKSALEREIAEFREQEGVVTRGIEAKKAEVAENEAEIDKIDKQKGELSAERDAINTVKRDAQTAQVRIQTKKEALEREESNPDTTEAELARLEEELQDYARGRVELAMKMESLVHETMNVSDSLMVAKIKVIQATSDYNHVTAEAGNASRDYNDAMNEYSRLDEEWKKATEKAKEVFRALQTVLGEAGKTEEDLRALINETSGSDLSVEDFEAQLEEEENTLRINQQQNSVGVMEAYEKRAKEIKEIEDRMSRRQLEIENVAHDIAHYRAVWEPRLEHLVRRVSDAFSKSFEQIGCAGEVLLSKTGRPDGDEGYLTDDFEKWEVQIKVKFRQTEKLQLLTGQRQSGGERSVSTIFYLMALQNMAKAPFRVVDEINQGMDPRNERLVHSQMVRAATQPGTSQYFLITPKLLPGLEYNKNMRILTINNGKFVPQDIDVANVIQLAKGLQDS